MLHHRIVRRVMMFTLFTVTTVSLSGCSALQTVMDQLAPATLRGLYMLIYLVAGLLVVVALLSVYIGAYLLPDWILFRGQTIGGGFMLRLIVSLIVMATAAVLVIPVRNQIASQTAQLGYRIEQGQGGNPGIPTNPPPPNLGR